MTRKLSTKVAMIGVGKLGQACAEVMAETYPVVGYDVMPREPRNFRMVDTVQEAVEFADIVFIAAPTPHDPLYDGRQPTAHLPNKDFDYTIVKEIIGNGNVNALEEELVEDELPTVEDQTNVLPPNHGDNSNVVLAEVNPANMRQEVEYNLSPNNLDNVVQVNLADNAANANNAANAANAGNANQVGSLLEEGSDNVLSANNTEHFLSVENASGNQNNVLTARIVCRASGFEKDSNLVNNGKHNANKGRVNNRPSCKPFTTENQFKDAQSNLVKCKENKHLLHTQGHGNMKNAPHGASL